MVLTNTKAKKHFKKIEVALLSLGFYILTKEEKERIRKLLDLQSPDLPRVKEGENQVSFQMEINWYKITCHSSFLEDVGNFTKTNRIWFHVTAPKLGFGEKRLFTISFFRTGNFSKRAVIVAKFLHDVLRNRPLDSRNTFMELIEAPIGTYTWVSVKRKMEMIPLIATSTRLKEIELDEVDKLLKQKAYYEGTTRPTKKITTRKRDERKEHTSATPNKAVPRVKK